MKTRKFLFLTWCFRSYYKIEVLVDSGKKVCLKVSAVTSWNISKVKIFVTLTSSRLLFDCTIICNLEVFIFSQKNLENSESGIGIQTVMTSLLNINFLYQFRVSRMNLQFLNEGRNVKAKFKGDIWPESKVALWCRECQNWNSNLKWILFEYLEYT